MYYSNNKDPDPLIVQRLAEQQAFLKRRLAEEKRMALEEAVRRFFNKGTPSPA